MKRSSSVLVWLGHFLISLLLAVSICVLMMVLAAFPPFSLLYDWLNSHHLGLTWNGLTGGVVAFCWWFMAIT